MYSARMDYVEFQEYLCEDMMTSQFNKFVEDDGTIGIEYYYGPYKNGVSTICWRVEEDTKQYKTRYTGSSRFAMWWCGITDGLEEDCD